MPTNSATTATYHLWTKRNSPAVVVGDDVRFAGSVRGYLTKPPILFTSTGESSFRLGGNRRIAPNRHILESAEGDVLAVFRTKRVTSPLETRATAILDADGGEIATLGVRGDRFRNRLEAAFKDDYQLTMHGGQAGSLGRCSATHGTQPGPVGRCRRFLTCPADLDARIAAGILFYWLSVMEPSKSVG